MSTRTILRTTKSAAEIIGSGFVSKTCRECGDTFTLDYPSLANLVHVCPTCSERHALADQQAKIEKAKAIRAVRWQQICPREFLQSERDRLPARQLADVESWQYGPTGLMLYGPTGRCKSRCAWLLAHREYESGRNVIALNSSAGLHYATKFGDSIREAENWIDRHSTAELLLLDDIFKARLTDAFESAIFMIVSQRTEARLPLIVTANDTGETLLQRFTSDRGEPLLRRLREFCRPIAFV